ncbi:hypothetical protein [Endothiovibrio diazotrophicus]
MNLELTERVGRKVDVISDDGIHHRLRDRILAEAQPLRWSEDAHFRRRETRVPYHGC